MSTQPRIAIITPTRGLIFTEVEEYIENVRDNYPNIRVYRSHNLPIPDCFNTLTEQALQDKKVEYLWYVEEDTVPPIQALDHLLEAMKNYDIAAVDYGFNGGWNTIVRSEITDEILFTGFGCTLIKRKVLEAFDHPRFKADKAFNISSMQWYPVIPEKVYGMYDIRFGAEAREKGFKFFQVEGECRHLQLLNLGAKEVNNGLHQIGEKDRISKKIKLSVINI